MRNKPMVEEWLTSLPADLQVITRELIEVARKNMRGMHEFIYHELLDIL